MPAKTEQDILDESALIALKAIVANPSEWISHGKQEYGKLAYAIACQMLKARNEVLNPKKPVKQWKEFADKLKSKKDKPGIVYTWTGKAGTNDTQDPSNWDPHGVPRSCEEVTFKAPDTKNKLLEWKFGHGEVCWNAQSKFEKYDGFTSITLYWAITIREDGLFTAEDSDKELWHNRLIDGEHKVKKGYATLAEAKKACQKLEDLHIAIAPDPATQPQTPSPGDPAKQAGPQSYQTTKAPISRPAESDDW